MNDTTVFGYRRGEGMDAGAGEPEWIVAKERHKYDQLFDTLNPVDGKITGSGQFRSFFIIQFLIQFIIIIY